MNSALQCLSNTVPLREYFVEGKFKNEVNKSNPLGMKGAIAENFGGLLREMWDGTHQSVNPKSLKHVIGAAAVMHNTTTSVF
jgi:ubiquitin carboxyl-terminal hydrolase 4/11/15